MTSPSTPTPPRQQDSGGPGAPRRSSLVWLALIVALTTAFWLWQSSAVQAPHPEIDYSAFFALVEEGSVEAVTLKGPIVQGTLREAKELEGQTSKKFVTTRPREDEALVPLLRDKGVQIRVSTEEQSWVLQLILSLLPWVLIIGVWVWVSRRARSMMAGPGGPLGGFLKGKSKKYDAQSRIEVSFDDVAGLKSAKQDLMEIIEFLKSPERFRRLGGKIPRGVLLVGPPGTGKTLLARAVAGEAGVPFYSISAAEFIELFVGVGARRVRDLFADAKKNAPAIIFIDEIDAVGRSRGAGLGGGHDEREQTLNQLLSEMDGFTRGDLTVVLAATNRPDVLDPALLRPGRFDRRIIVGRPECDARRAILEVHTKKKPLADDVSLETIAKNTPGFSGADLENLVNEAALHAIRRGGQQIEAADFSAAYDKVVLGNPREGKLDPNEKKRVAVHESGHAVVAHFTPSAEELHRVTIIPRGMALGVTQQSPSGDRLIMTQPELESRLRVLMGGYAAERLILGSISTGAENDLREATKLATQMVAHYGMSDELGAVYYDYQTEHPFLGQRIATDSGTSDATVYSIERQARELLAAALEGAAAILAGKRGLLEQLVAELLEHETIERDQLRELLGEPTREAEQAPSARVHTA